MHGETYLKKIGVFLSAYQNKKEDYLCALSNKGEAEKSWDIIEEILKST